MARLRIGIVLYENSRPELERLARSLAASEPSPDLELEVRVLDNSPEAALEPVVTALLGQGTYRWTGSNLGYGAAHNRGMREAFASGAGAYLCLNPDAVLHPRCLPELWITASRPDTGLVDARTFPEEHPKPYDPETGDTPWCTGTALLVRPAAFAASGGFDEALFMYGEDVDLSWRVRAAGLRARTAPGALVHHWVEHRPLTLERELRVLRSAAYLGRKWGDQRFAVRYERSFRARAGQAPELHAKADVPAAARRLADLSHGVRFARSRW
ncbi:MAG TPA: glycosyltransferase family 2 protein [Myxococcaceae bacterium]|nr:glycosyltransferase family 2 protein [Myxococcaceae bacterium]